MFIDLAILQDLLVKLDAEVTEHVAYNDACNAFNTWLRATREKLATCSDTYGDEPAIAGKLDKVKVLDYLSC